MFALDLEIGWTPFFVPFGRPVSLYSDSIKSLDCTVFLGPALVTELFLGQVEP